jgi:hypothetical protein
MTHRAMSRDLALTNQHALSEEEYAEQRWAFDAFLRGERDLAGDLIGESVDCHD